MFRLCLGLLRLFWRQPQDEVELAVSHIIHYKADSKIQSANSARYPTWSLRLTGFHPKPHYTSLDCHMPDPECKPLLHVVCEPARRWISQCDFQAEAAASLKINLYIHNWNIEHDRIQQAWTNPYCWYMIISLILVCTCILPSAIGSPAEKSDQASTSMDPRANYCWLPYKFQLYMHRQR